MQNHVVLSLGVAEFVSLCLPAKLSEDDEDEDSSIPDTNDEAGEDDGEEQSQVVGDGEQSLSQADSDIEDVTSPKKNPGEVDVADLHLLPFINPIDFLQYLVPYDKRHGGVVSMLLSQTSLDRCFVTLTNLLYEWSVCLFGIERK